MSLSPVTKQTTGKARRTAVAMPSWRVPWKKTMAIVDDTLARLLALRCPGLEKEFRWHKGDEEQSWGEVRSRARAIRGFCAESAVGTRIKTVSMDLTDPYRIKFLGSSVHWSIPGDNVELEDAMKAKLPVSRMLLEHGHLFTQRQQTVYVPCLQ